MTKVAMRALPETDASDVDYLLIETAKSGKLEDVRHLLSRGCQDCVVDNFGRTALHWVAQYGYVQIVYLLLDYGWDVNLKDNKQQTPLHIACNFKRSDVATCLITMGCDVNMCDIHENSPLHRAIHANLETVVFMLCDAGANIDARNDNFWTPLHEAVRAGNINIVTKLIRKKAYVNHVTRTAMTPFLTAIFYYRIAQRKAYVPLDEILESLMEFRCRLSYSDGQWCPLSAAISIDNSYIAALLLLHGCRIEKRSRYSRSLLVETFSRCDMYVVRLLVLCGHQVTTDEVEQCCRRVPTFSKSFLRLTNPPIHDGRERTEVLRWLKRKSQEPFSLSELCRQSIRLSLNEGSGDTSIVHLISSLPLPRIIQRFIALADSAPTYLNPTFNRSGQTSNLSVTLLSASVR